MNELMETYFGKLYNYLSFTQITDSAGDSKSFEKAQEDFLRLLVDTVDYRAKLIFIGNGGSAAIASHMALDYTKAGNVTSLCLNDMAALTAYSNDNGYEKVFSSQLYNHLKPHDTLIAISSSGESKNILNAVDYVRDRSIYTVTFSGFDTLNPLRKKGHMNFFVPSNSYGFVEISHLTILHALLDIHNGSFK